MLVASLALALLLGAWKLALEPRLPEPLRPRPHPAGTLRWLDDGRVPAYVQGEERAEAWLALGDSRVHHGLDRDALAARGLEPPALLWVGGAQLEKLLAAARELPQRRVLVALSPLSVHRVVLSPEREREAALAVSERPWNARVDAALDERLTALRSALVRWIDTRALERAWLEAPAPDATDARLRRALGPPTRAARAAALTRVERALAELAREGRSLRCVRFPVSPSVRAIEDEAFDPVLFERLCARRGLSYLDLGTRYETIDGSHLSAPAARSLASELADWLERR